jgi:imidazolonepropionase-like amidohydrolase
MSASKRPLFAFVLVALVAFVIFITQAAETAHANSTEETSSTRPEMPQDAAPVAAAAIEPLDSYAFVDVTVLPMHEEGMLANQTVVVEDGIITKIGKVAEVEVPEGALSIDGKGKFLIPGLIDMHSHLPRGAQSQITQEGFLAINLMNGVTTLRGMIGEELHLSLREQIARRELLGPRLIVGSPAYKRGRATNRDEARRLVKQDVEAGYDFIKVHEAIPAPIYNQVAETAAEHGLQIAGHVSDYVGLHGALAVGQSTIDHLDNTPEALTPKSVQDAHIGRRMPYEILIAEATDDALADTIRRYKEAGTGSVPTLCLFVNLLSVDVGASLKSKRPGMEFVNPSTVARWVRTVDSVHKQAGEFPIRDEYVNLRERIVKSLFDAGVPVMIGTDSPQTFNIPGFAMRHEMSYFKRAGLNNWQVLRAATFVPAQFMARDGEFGSVQEGRFADLVLLNSNPLNSIYNTFDSAGTMVAGQWLPKSWFTSNTAQFRGMLDE